MARKASGNYTASDITVLKGLEPVRRRPAMYIGGVDARGLHHLVWEILDNSVDEAINGFATCIEVTLDADRRGIAISDDGRGIPVDVHPETKRSALETILTTLHAGGKFEGGNYIHSGGLHGVGSSVVNALSERLLATVRRDGFEWRQEFRRGEPKRAIERVGPARGHGTTIYFRPDAEIFDQSEFEPARIAETLEARAYLHRGLEIVYRDEATGEKKTFRYEDGIKAFLQKLVKERGKSPTADFVFYLERQEEPRLEIALQWTDETGEFVRSFANGIATPAGGTHEQGLRNGVVKALRGYIESHGLDPRGVALASEDYREGLSAVLSVYLLEPQFQGQTKDRLNNPEMTAQVATAVGTALEHYFNQNGTVAQAVVARVILAARARAASRAAQDVVRKSPVSHRLNLPGKLADCESTRPDASELFIVEGDSAGGTAKQARDRKTQAILPLRGKILNTESVPLPKLVESRELADLVSALGCGIGKAFDIGKLRYHKIIILTDADQDGHHIATLLLTFFYRHLPELIRAGHVYLGLPPLYKIQHSAKTHWAWSDGEKAALVTKLGGVKDDAITRFKGLGEMSAKELEETTMSVRTRSLERVAITDELVTDRVVAELMGKDAGPRYRLVTEQALEADDVDI